MNNSISNPADISIEDCHKLFSSFEEHNSQENTPTTYFNSLPHDLQLEFFDKIELQCNQILLKGYKSWAYKKYRYDQNKEEGVLNLSADVRLWLFTSSEKNSFVNLQEIFKNGPDKVNRNLRGTIKRVLAANREKTVIDQLLRRIETIVDDENSNFSRTRGLKEDFFSLTEKFPSERIPTNDEIEVVISKIGDFREEPVKANARQAPRIYSTPVLIELFTIICETLDTEVTPNILETIFLDLIPGFLPNEFVAEQAFKIYGHVNFPIDVENNLSYNDLSQEDKIIVDEAVQETIDTVKEQKIESEIKYVRELLQNQNFRISALAKVDGIRDRQHAEEILEKLGDIVNNIFSNLNEDQAEIAFSEFFSKI